MEEMTERDMGIVEAILRESSIGHHMVDKAALDMISDVNVLESLLIDYVIGCDDRARTEQAVRFAALA